MLWLVFTVILGLIALGSLIAVMGSSSPEGRVGGIATLGVTVLVWLALTVGLSLHTVGQREVGLVQSFSGTIGNDYKSPGVVWAAPWNHIKTENVGLQKEVFNFGADNSAVSKDQQPITAVLAVNFQVQPAQVVKLYKEVGPAWKTILLDGRIPQAFKETTAKFTSPEITLRRPQLRLDTLARLRAELGRYDIRVVDVFVSNVGYSNAYNAAIEEKQVQVQAALRAEAKVKQSQAEAQQAIAVAEGEAKAISLKGKAIRENPEVLKLEALKRLAPNAQVIYCSTGDCPSFLGSFGGK